MRASDATVLQILLDADKINSEDVKKLQDQVRGERRAMQDAVIKDGIITDRELTKLYAKAIEVPYIELNPKKINKEALKQIPERIARQYNVVLFSNDDGIKHLAMDDPDDVQAVDFIKKQLGQDIKVYIACKEDILSALDQYRESITNEISDVITEVENLNDEKVDEADLAEDSPIAQTVNLILEYAIKTGASDIHIEPRDNHVQIRYRLDGVLKEANKLPKKVLAALVSRIKILSNLKIDERRAPQDGRFKININGRVFAFRVSTLPLVDGEKVVMRVLDESTEPLSLEKLGFWGDALVRINHAITQPHGMILVTGPTGSGKSTTLQSVLNILNNPDINISTVEDPVEYRLEGVNQTQVNNKAGMTFVNGLRALLRQDPNVIMVGEIRDGETAGLAVQAALTGHLVLSTLHTNNASTCLPRLLDMGIEPFLIASTVRVVIGQRLVRRINPDECEEYTPDEIELKEIEKEFGLKGPEDWKRVFAMAKQADSNIDINSTDQIKLFRPKMDGDILMGGYKGRMGIYEVLENTQDIQKLIVSNSTSNSIQAVAVGSGMATMQVDGLVKALIGWTSIEEILRVTRE
jgi:type IV pilus assembly protein PilB